MTRVRLNVLVRDADPDELNRALAESVDRRRFRRSSPIAFVAGVGRVLASMVLTGGDEEVDSDLAVHLESLRELSRRFDRLRFAIELSPDGGVLGLAAGVFDDEDAVATLLRAGDESEPGGHLALRVMAPPDLHLEILGELVESVLRALPNQPTPTIERTLASVELRFEAIDRDRLTLVIHELRNAWHRLGWQPQVWATVALTGVPAVERAVTRAEDWTELLLSTRARPAAADDEQPDLPPLVELARYPHLADLLDGDDLLWDGRGDRQFKLSRAGHLFERHAVLPRLPPVPPGARRQILATLKSVPLYSDTIGDGSSCTIAFGKRGGTTFRNVRAIAVCETSVEVLLACELRGVEELVVFGARTRAWSPLRPWNPPWRCAGLGVLSVEELAAIVGDGTRQRLLVLGMAYGDARLEVDLPCTGADLVGCARDRVWFTGRRDGRHDLYELERATGALAIRTASLPADGWGPVEAARAGDRWMVVYERHGVLVAEPGRPFEPIELAVGAIAALSRNGTVACARGEPSRLVLARGRDLRFTLDLDDAAPTGGLVWWSS